MGLFCSRLRKSLRTNRDYRRTDSYESLEDVKAALRGFGLEACQLIVGIDFTKSNTWTGKLSFGGKCLHEVGDTPNPYETALSIIARTLEDFDDDNLIPCYGFGDMSTEDNAVFSFNKNDEKSHGLESLIQRYREIAMSVKLYGPTSFAPLIRRAILHVYDAGMRFHILLILADGQISRFCFRDTVNAIVEACYFPLAIIMVGIGDGPWEAMRQFDNDLPQRPWDNFQFVQFDRLFNNPAYNTEERRQAGFAMHALMEVPDQFKICETRISETLDTSTKIISKIRNTVKVEQPPDFVHVAEVLNPYGTGSEFSLDDYKDLF